MTTIVYDAWNEYSLHARNEEGPKPTAADTLQRCSDTGVCLRQRGFTAAGIEEVHTIDPGTLLAFGIGTTIHESIQAAILHTYPQATVEDKIDLSHLGVSLSGHCDGRIPELDAILEVKTMSGYGAKVAWENDAPKREHIAQAALYALGLNVANVLLVYVAKESNFRPPRIKPGDTREWMWGLDDECLEGWTPRMLAEEELGRFEVVESELAKGMLPSPWAPDDTGQLNLITDPDPYGEKGTGYWGCRYCRFRDLCYEIGATPVEIATLLP